MRKHKNKLARVASVPAGIISSTKNIDSFFKFLIFFPAAQTLKVSLPINACILVRAGRRLYRSWMVHHQCWCSTSTVDLFSFWTLASVFSRVSCVCNPSSFFPVRVKSVLFFFVVFDLSSLGRGPKLYCCRSSLIAYLWVLPYI